MDNDKILLLLIFFIVQLQIVSLNTPRKVTGNCKGDGISKAKVLKKYEANLEVPEECGIQNKKASRTTHWHCMC